MKKWILRSGSALSALILLLVGTLFFLTGTERGTSILLDRVTNLLNGTLHIGSSSGALLDRLELQDILLQSPTTGIIKINRLVFDWKSSDLLHLPLHVLELSADTIFYPPPTTSDQDTPDSNEPFTLPEIRIPVNITVAKLELRNFIILSATGNSETFVLNNAGIALHWNKKIFLQQLNISLPQITITASGEINPTGNYPLQLTTSVSTTGPDIPSVEIQGKYTGTLEKLDIKEKVRGDIHVGLDVQILSVLNDPTYRASLDITSLQPKLFNPDIPGDLTGKIECSGNLLQLSATAALGLRDAENSAFNVDASLNADMRLDTLATTINKLTIQQLNSESVVDLSGTIDDTRNMDLILQWQELQWPLTGKSTYSTARGQISIHGTSDNYHLDITNALIAGNNIPAATIQLSGDGSLEKITNIILQSNLLDGSVTIKGNVQWSPAINWQLESIGQGINPGIKYSEWPGKLTWQLVSSGDMNESGVTADVAITTLQGSLRELPIAGTGQIEVSPVDITINNLLVSSGDATISANGTIGQHSQLEWAMNISDFSDLYPGAEGTLLATGGILGRIKHPRLNLQLQGSAIAFQDIKLAGFQADADLDLSWQSPFNLNISGSSLEAGQNILETFRLKGSGTKEEHHLQISAAHPLAELTLDVKGGYDNEQWRGAISKLDLHSADFGIWRLEQAAQLSAGTTAAKLDSVCLSSSQSALCLAGAWEPAPNKTEAELKLTSLPLTILSPWFPDSVTDFSGSLSGNASITMTENLKAGLTVEISPGSISYFTSKKEKNLPHEGGRLELHVLENSLDADFNMGIDSNSFTARLKSPDILTGLTINSDARLNGNITVHAQEFEIIEALIPAVQNLEAAMDINLNIQGSVSKPDINGQGTIDIPRLFIPKAGLDLRNTTFSLLSDSTELSFKGKLKSRSGFMNLDGRATLDASRNWPFQASLKGRNFRLINLPETRLFISSNLLLKREDGVLGITGEVAVPRAEILLRELPTGSQTASPDVVILQEKKKEDTSLPLHTDLKLTLGDNIHFAGFGLNAFINGQLHILAEPDEPMTGSGAFYIKQGHFRAYGQDLTIETGVISFPGGPLTQPGINLRATRNVGDIVAGINAIGPATKPRITTFSNPPMSESQVISYLLTGEGPGGDNKGAKVSIGRQINNKLSVSVGTDVKTGDSEFVTRYRLSHKIYVQTTTAANGNAADIFYTFETGKLTQKKTEPKPLPVLEE